MVREAQKAGLEFDEEKLEALNCCHEEPITLGGRRQPDVPAIAINPGSPTDGSSTATADAFVDIENFANHHRIHSDTDFDRLLHFAATKGRIHDSLEFGGGGSRGSVATWKAMEYMPFRRMDLHPDGTWKAIRWPLPMGETRDIPHNAVVHSSVIKRMLADPTYRPGNLIVGGGGRGVRRAPEALGIGKWQCVREYGHPVGECFVKKQTTVGETTKDSSSSAMPDSHKDM
jgi:hypothetical protein